MNELNYMTITLDCTSFGCCIQITQKYVGHC